MTTAIVTGSAGLIGSETVRALAARGVEVAGVDNDMRRHFFGDEASTKGTRDELAALKGYTHHDLDIRDPYLMKCVAIGRQYSVFGYKGKPVRDNIHSADVVSAFLAFWDAPTAGGQVYNLGGGRFSNCSMLEAIEKCERIAGRRLEHTYQPANRVGDHIWYISDLRKFKTHYPGWRQQFDLDALLQDIYDHNVERWTRERA